MDLRISPIYSDQKNALKKTLKYLEEVTGRTPKKLEIPSWKYASKLWRYFLTEEPEKIENELTNRTVFSSNIVDFISIEHFNFRAL
jgi:hypothetical protein